MDPAAVKERKAVSGENAGHGDVTHIAMPAGESGVRGPANVVRIHAVMCNCPSVDG